MILCFVFTKIRKIKPPRKNMWAKKLFPFTLLETHEDSMHMTILSIIPLNSNITFFLRLLIYTIILSVVLIFLLTIFNFFLFLFVILKIMHIFVLLLKTKMFHFLKFTTMVLGLFFSVVLAFSVVTRIYMESKDLKNNY